MTARDDAIGRVKRLSAATVKPVVSDADLAAIVDTYPLVDNNGLGPSSPGWAPTYDTNAAIAEVYAQKAATVSADYNFTADDASYSKGDVLANLLAMEAKFRAMAKTAGGGLSTGATSSTIQVSGTNA